MVFDAAQVRSKLVSMSSRRHGDQSPRAFFCHLRCAMCEGGLIRGIPDTVHYRPTEATATENMSANIFVCEDPVRPTPIQSAMVSVRTGRHMVLWLCTTTVSLTTTKYLLHNGLHFPMHLLLLHVTLTLALRLAKWISHRVHACAYAKPRTTCCAWRYIQPITKYQWLYVAFLSVALPCDYQAILHFQQLPTVAMILTLDYQANEHIVFDGLRNIVRRFLMTIGVVMIVVFDLRPSIVGITMAIAAIASTATAQVVIRRHQTPPTQLAFHTGNHATITLNTLCLLGVTLSTLCCCLIRERQFGQIWTFEVSATNLVIVILNLSCSVLTLDSEDFIFQPLIDNRGSNAPAWLAYPNARVVLSIALVCLTSTGLIFTSISPMVISPWQIIGYGMTVFITLSTESCADRIPSFADLDFRCRQDLVEEDAADLSNNTAATNRACDTACCRNLIHSRLLLIFPALLLIFLCRTLATHNTPSASLLNTSIRPNTSSRALDIVVARYEESIEDVASMISELLKLPDVYELQPNIEIYNKGGLDFSEKDLEKAISCSPRPRVTISSLSNVGREADTYLEHIIKHWQDLATHTMFMQAGVHFGPRAYLRHIRNNFVPTTGFLSLAPSGGFCLSCNNCHDRDWTEDPAILNSLFRDFNNGTECADIALTYRGQFIASAVRIRSNQKETYQRWLNELREPDGLLHLANYTNSVYSVKRDSMSAPRAGFTLERTWGVMMRCNERRIAFNCPSFLSSFLCPPAICGRAILEDCQCLDH